MYGRMGADHPYFGKYHSADIKALMSEAMIGKNNPNFGKTYSVETKTKMSEAKKGKNNVW